MQGVLFYHTKKVSLGLGFKWGTGFMITQKDTKKRPGLVSSLLL